MNINVRTYTFVYDVMVTLSGWSKRKMVSRWQGSKSWAWPVGGTAPLHTWVFTCAHARVLGAFVYLDILEYLCSVHLYTFSYLYTWGTQHHQRVPRLCKYTSANSLDNNSQSERIPSEEGRVQIGQNAMALEGGGQSVIRIIKLKNLELKLWPRIFIIFCLQYCMHVSTVCIICTTFFSPPWMIIQWAVRRQNSRGLDELATLFIVHEDIIFFFFIFSNWIFHLPNGIILSRPAFWTQTLAFRCEVPGAPLPPDTKALILLHTLKMKFNRTRQGL